MNEATLDYVRQHADEDVRQLALQGTKNPEVDLTWALDQIAGRQQARTKLPSWAATDGIVYPPHLSMEQCSSEQTARYKARLLSSLTPHPTLLVDLTGGFGVDFAFMAKTYAQHLIFVEQQERLCQCAERNFQLLGLQDVKIVCGDAAEALHRLDHASIIYLDPARRDKQGARTYDISDCTPNVLAMKDELLQKADHVLLKLSPMLDWRKAVSDLGTECVREVHIVSVGNECKELLILLSKNLVACQDKNRAQERPLASKGRLVCVNDGSVFETALSFEPSMTAPYRRDFVGRFLYEPNASIMKAGCFAEVATRFGVSQLAANSHLFVSPDFIEDFPGRKFQISAISSTNKRELKTALAGITQANITVRNFPMTVAELRHRLKLRDGGNTYIFATTLADSSHTLLICTKAVFII